MTTEWRCSHGWLRGEQCTDCADLAHSKEQIKRLMAERDALHTLRHEREDVISGLRNEIERLTADRDSFKADAERYHWLIDKMQASYDGDEQEVPEDFAVYCNMLSAWRTERTVRAEITWTDTRDERLGISGAIDAARAALGETK